MKFEHELDRLKREEGQRPEESLQPIDDETAVQTTQTRTLKKLHKSGAPSRMSRTPHRCSRLRLPQRSPPPPGSGACCASRTPPSSSRTLLDRACVLRRRKAFKIFATDRCESAVDSSASRIEGSQRGRTKGEEREGRNEKKEE